MTVANLLVEPDDKSILKISRPLVKLRATVYSGAFLTRTDRWAGFCCVPPSSRRGSCDRKQLSIVSVDRGVN